MSKKIKVQVTFSWEFDKKEWNEHKNHLKDIENEVKINVGYDPISAIHSFNDITYPKVENVEIYATK
jgi:hypothetical protein